MNRESKDTAKICLKVQQARGERSLFLNGPEILQLVYTGTGTYVDLDSG
jgi:hypothetical protein